MAALFSSNLSGKTMKQRLSVEVARGIVSVFQKKSTDRMSDIKMKFPDTQQNGQHPWEAKRFIEKQLLKPLIGTGFFSRLEEK